MMNNFKISKIFSKMIQINKLISLACKAQAQLLK